MKQGLAHQHCPVLVQEVLKGLDVHSQALYVDGTIGSGGHCRAILDLSAPDGRVLGIDIDPEALERAKKNLKPYGERVLFQEGNYVEIQRILDAFGFSKAQGILLDLGASYEQLTSGKRGFSFRKRAPLDMRFSPRIPMTAEQIINHRSEQELKQLFKSYGEERWAGRIARAIVRIRPIRSTVDLALLVAKAVPGRRGRVHPATRVFQALRIEVNRELENLEQGIKGNAISLSEGGRLCVISYHSLEDRLVKRLFQELSLSKGVNTFRILTPKPIRPTPEEVTHNPRARSAKLRILQATGGVLAA